jgi:hypothetical protein
MSKDSPHSAQCREDDKVTGHPAPFIDYLNAVDELLESRHGITSNDVDMAPIAGCQDEGLTPEECSEWFEDKYELERIDTDPCGGKKCVSKS